MEIFSDAYFMHQAYKEALRAMSHDEVPVGAVVVSGDTVIARTFNQTEQLKDCTAHAEILAITAASNYLGSKYLNDCTLFVTLEPCSMCAGALYWSRIGRVVFAAEDPKRGFMRYGREFLHPTTRLEMGVMSAECSELIRSFFSKKRSAFKDLKNNLPE